jgi:tRNA modification GTPase
MITEDTITAISTPGGMGAIGIIRITGSKAHDIVNRVFKGKPDIKESKPNTIFYGKIFDLKTGKDIDEVLVSKFAAPKSYTREDMVEINTHGSMVVQKKILNQLIDLGARLAEPGEFTKRCFLNGRIDLAQAEGVIDIINAKTEISSKTAIAQLEGSISKRISEIRNEIIEAMAKMEVLIDYPEYEAPDDSGSIIKSLKPVANKLDAFIKSYETGRIIKEGINAVIIGKPNVGKSSLLNRLSGIERSIVTEVPGTTRDIIMQQISINGLLLNVIDTAGIRETNDIVEMIGVKRTKNEIEKADLIIAILDASNSDIEEEKEIIKQTKNRNYIIVINKIDIADNEKIKLIEKHLGKSRYIETSIKEDTGIDKIEETIYNMFISDELKLNTDSLITNIRHKKLLEKAKQSLDNMFGEYQRNMALDILAIDLKSAAEALGEITGENVNEEVLKTIFERFCLGK